MCVSQRISPQFVLDGFACGNHALDAWLKNAARSADAMGTARTYVWTAPDRRAVVGYFSLCPHEVPRDELPARLAHGAPQAIPAILLARLALDRTLHGNGLRASLLLDALTRAADAIAIAGGRLVVVVERPP